MKLMLDSLFMPEFGKGDYISAFLIKLYITSETDQPT